MSAVIVRKIQEVSQKAPVHPWEQPRKPWKRQHIDFAGPFCGSVWLSLYS